VGKSSSSSDKPLAGVFDETGEEAGDGLLALKDSSEGTTGNSSRSPSAARLKNTSLLLRIILLLWILPAITLMY